MQDGQIGPGIGKAHAGLASLTVPFPCTEPAEGAFGHTDTAASHILLPFTLDVWQQTLLPC